MTGAVDARDIEVQGVTAAAAAQTVVPTRYRLTPAAPAQALAGVPGATRGQLMRMMSVEALLTALAGIALGTIVAVATLVPFELALDRTTWPHGPLWIYVAVAGGAVLLTFVATLGPATAVVRSRSR